jgi:hypothetical protein
LVTAVMLAKNGPKAGALQKAFYSQETKKKKK